MIWPLTPSADNTFNERCCYGSTGQNQDELCDFLMLFAFSQAQDCPGGLCYEVTVLGYGFDQNIQVFVGGVEVTDFTLENAAVWFETTGASEGEVTIIKDGCKNTILFAEFGTSISPSLTPNSAPAVGGTPVLITQYDINFTLASDIKVYFKDVLVPHTVQDGQTLEVITPVWSQGESVGLWVVVDSDFGVATFTFT